MAHSDNQQCQSRRGFLKTAGAVLGAGVASRVIYVPPLVRASSGDQVCVAAVGVGGKGATDIAGVSKYARVVALCDVDQARAASSLKRYPEARFYTDWRKMLEKEARNLDAVTVSTPDHMHAPVTMTALGMGLATYTQKPLTRTVYEARQLTAAAERVGVATQMGTQHHSGIGYRMTVALIRSGTIGRIKEAHTWSNRPIWPQGLDRPAGSDPVPETLNWDSWLGVAPERPFKAQWPDAAGQKGKQRNVYVPFSWRGWYDFGAGALGDMGCHIIDPVYWSLELTAPNWVKYNGPAPKAEMFPTEETLTYEFPGTQYTTDDTIVVKWYDGGRKPPRDLAQMGVQASGKDTGKPLELPDNGSLFVGTKGTLMCPHGSGPQLFPQARFRDLERPKLAGLDHYKVWIDGIEGDGKTNCSFAYAGPLAETVLLGVIASRVPEQRLQWNRQQLRFTNSDKANSFVRPEYRSGWHVEGLG